MTQAVSSSTIRFLKDLSKNNHREWFLSQKDRFDAAHDDVKQLARELEHLLNQKDIIESAKVFRIYRDVRFSKDKAPYKNHFGIHFTRATPARRGGYYLHIEPGGSFAGGGFWAPDPKDLKRMRDEFAFDDSRIRKILSSAAFKKYFGVLQGDELKTAPSGYERDHPAVDLLRKKNFYVMRSFSDKDVTSPGFTKEVTKTFEAMRPYFDYMSEVLTTDINGRSLLS